MPKANYIFVYLAVIFITGCVHTSFCLTNRSGQKITLLSEHTKLLSIIDIDESKNIEHTIGSLTITTNDGKKWWYHNLSVPDMNQLEYLERRTYLFSSTLKLYLLLNQNGMIYILPKTQKHIDSPPLNQPKGYPLLPTSIP